MYDSGAVYMRSGGSGGSTSEEVDLGTPTKAYVESSQYISEKEEVVVYLIPALVFPLSKKLYDYGPSVIVVPLAKELVSMYTTGGSVPPASGSGSSSSGAADSTVMPLSIPAPKPGLTF